MKRIIYLLLVFFLIGFYSCGNSGKEKEKASAEEVNGSGPCDEFLTNYEEWIDEYLEVIDTYFKNPEDEANATRYMELMQEAMQWSTKWVTLIDCADDEKYAKRFEEISKEVEEKLKELQL